MRWSINGWYLVQSVTEKLHACILSCRIVRSEAAIDAALITRGMRESHFLHLLTPGVINNVLLDPYCYCLPAQTNNDTMGMLYGGAESGQYIFLWWLALISSPRKHFFPKDNPFNPAQMSYSAIWYLAPVNISSDILNKNCHIECVNRWIIPQMIMDFFIKSKQHADPLGVSI